MEIRPTLLTAISGHEGIAIRLHDMNSGYPAVPVTVSIHEGTITGPVVPGSVVNRDEPYGGWQFTWTEFLFQETVNLVPGEIYVFEVFTENARWGIRTTGDDCYEPGSMIRDAIPRDADLMFRTLCDPSPSSLSSRIHGEPSSGFAPLTSYYSLRFSHSHEGQTRVIAGRIDITLGNGQFVPNWRAGYTNVQYDTPQVVPWWFTLPGIYPVLGTNLFEFTVEDVTPAPYNQPPYAPSGDMDTDFCDILVYGEE